MIWLYNAFGLLLICVMIMVCKRYFWVNLLRRVDVHIVCIDSNREHIFEAQGGISTVVACLSAPNTNVVITTCGALTNISMDNGVFHPRSCFD